MVAPRLHPALTAAVLVLCLGCQAPAPGGPSQPGRTTSTKATKPTPAPSVGRAGEVRRIPQQGPKIRLTGFARLIANPGGPLVSDQGGSLISDQGGALLGNNGGGIISNNGGGMFGKTKFRRLLQAGPGLGVYGLAEAEVRLFDGAGRLLVDDAGQPLTATTGPDAAFKLEAVLPPGNLVARIALWNGGELTAIVAPEGAQSAALELSTASSLGASYVLGLVKGDQAILDKLPRSESDRLNRELDIVRGFATGAFKHDTATLDAITAKLRQRVPAVDQVAEDVRALLLGQSRLGEGRLATEVPLAGPLHLALSPEGRLLIGEQQPGRIRELTPEGTLAMLLDKTHGRIKNNAPSLSGLVEGPGGVLYGLVSGNNRVYRISRDGETVVAFGSGKGGRDAPGEPTAMAATPSCLALGLDGTLWIGEGARKGFTPPRLLALKPDGRVEAETPDGVGSFVGLAFRPTGELLALRLDGTSGLGSLWRRGADSRWLRLADGLEVDERAGLCVTAEGKLLVSEGGRGRVLALQPDDTLAPLAGLAPGPQTPGSLAAHPDGRVFIADVASNVVWEKRGDAPARVVAGTAAVFQAGETQAFAINAPTSIAADDQGGLYISESGSHTVKRFDGKALTIVAGSVQTPRADLGDGGPAAAARLRVPRGIWWQGGSLYVLDNGNRRIRQIGPDGIIQTVVSGTDLLNDWGLALGPDGRPWWTRAPRGIVARASAGGGTETAVGTAPTGTPNVGALVLGLSGEVGTDPAQLRMAMPTGITRDPEGHMVFCDAIGGRIYRLRTSGPQAGAIEVVAGIPFSEALARGEAQKSGGPERPLEGVPARDIMLSVPLGLAYDAKSNLYVAEGGDRNLEAMAPLLGDTPFPPDLLPGRPPRVRRITPDGTITTVAGPGGKFFSDPEAEDALYVPACLAVMSDGRLAIGDLGSNLVRILPAGRY